MTKVVAAVVACEVNGIKFKNYIYKLFSPPLSTLYYDNIDNSSSKEPPCST